MKNWWLIPLIVAVGIALAAPSCYIVRRGHAKRIREANYQSMLQSYSAILKPGVSRKDVEQSIRTRGINFERRCCITQSEYDDFVRIGNEPAPWYCSEHNVFLAFRFQQAWPEPSDSDVLKTISVEHKLDNCL
jgi:hypothetical protein